MLLMPVAMAADAEEDVRCEAHGLRSGDICAAGLRHHQQYVRSAVQLPTGPRADTSAGRRSADWRRLCLATQFVSRC